MSEGRLVGAVSALVAIGVLLSAGAASAQVVRIINSSSWDVHYLFLSYTNDQNWGPDQLGQYVLQGGGGYIDIPAPCASYDVRMVDQDGDECVVSNLYLCNEAVYFTDDDLLSCQGETQLFGQSTTYGSPYATCGLGYELVLVLPPLMWLRRRRR